MITMTKTKRFSQKHPVIFSLVLSFLSLRLWAVDIDGNSLGGFDMLITHIITSGLCMAFIYSRSSMDIVGFKKIGLRYGLLLGIPFYIIGIISALFSNVGIDFANQTFLGVPILLLFTVNMFIVGSGEELLFRGIILRLFLNEREDNLCQQYKAVFISAGIFGLVHLANLFVLPPITVFVQTINATSAGILFSMIYLKSKNIIAVIIIHGIVDWFALFLQQCFSGGGSIITEQMDWPTAVFVVIAGSLPVLLISFLYARKPLKKPSM